MTDDVTPKVELPEPVKRWQYLQEWCAWWLVLDEGGAAVRRGYGPFNETEAVWAGEVHGVPFPPQRLELPG